MSAKVFVGNLNYRTTEEQLREFFGDLGEVASVAIPKDRESGRPRGFAFVEFVSAEHARLAVRVYDGRTLDGRPLKVSPATDRPKKAPPAAPVAAAAKYDDEPDLPDLDFDPRDRRRDRAWRRERAAKRSL